MTCAKGSTPIDSGVPTNRQRCVGVGWPEGGMSWKRGQGRRVEGPHHPTLCPAISCIHHFWCSRCNNALQVEVDRKVSGLCCEALEVLLLILLKANLADAGLARPFSHLFGFGFRFAGALALQ